MKYYCVLTTERKAASAEIALFWESNSRPKDKSAVEGKITYYNDWFNTREEAQAFAKEINQTRRRRGERVAEIRGENTVGSYPADYSGAVQIGDAASGH